MSAMKENIIVESTLVETKSIPTIEEYISYQHKKFQWRERDISSFSSEDKGPEVVVHPIKVKREVENQVQNPGERPVKKRYFCPYCGKGYADRSSQRRHIKTHDPNTKKFHCSVCFKNDQFQKSNWRAHVATHIGEDIPLEVFRTLDSETIAILDGTDPYLTPKMLEYRLARAESKKRRMSTSDNNAAKRIKLSQSFTDLLYPICSLQE